MNPAQAIEVVIVGADHPQRLALAEALQRDLTTHTAPHRFHCPTRAEALAKAPAHACHLLWLSPSPQAAFMDLQPWRETLHRLGRPYQTVRGDLPTAQAQARWALLHDQPHAMARKVSQRHAWLDCECCSDPKGEQGLFARLLQS